jgi:predicted dehydrogenase
MVIETIGRRLRLAVIGGGPGSVIGEVHRIAARLDGYYDIVAATLSSDPERARRAGIAIGVPEDRAYPSAQALIEGEAERADPPTYGINCRVDLARRKTLSPVL